MIMTMIRRIVGMPVKYFMQNAVAMAPTSICPSAPMFQKRIANAGASPTPSRRSVEESLKRFQKSLGELKLARNMVA